MTTGDVGSMTDDELVDPDPPAPADGRPWRQVCVAATVLCAVLAVVDIGGKSLWYDEGFSVSLGYQPLSRALWRIANFEVNGSPYYLLLVGWYDVVRGEGALRLLSVVFAVATVPLVFALGRTLYDARTGALAAVLFAMHGTVIELAQTLRAYTIAIFLVTAASYLFVKALREPSTRRSATYAVVAVVAVYAHHLSLLVLVAHGVSALSWRPLPRRLVSTAGAIGAVLLAPLAAHLLTLRRDPLGWIPPPSIKGVGQMAVGLAGGWIALVPVFGLAVVLGVLAVWTAVREAPRSRRSVGELLPVWWALLPVALLVAISLSKPLLVPRYLAVVIPALCLLAALAVTRLAERWIAVAAVAVLLATSAAGVVHWYRSPPSEDWRSATAFVRQNLRPDDGVLVVPANAFQIVGYYDRRAGGSTLGDAEVSPGGQPSESRLWVVQRRARSGVGELSPSAARWIRDHYVPVEERRFAGHSGVVVSLYERR